MVELREITMIHAPIECCFDLARSVEVHLAGNVHWGEQAIAAGGVTSGLIGLGQRLTSEITAMDRPAYFQDAMIDGPFAWMKHDHFFRTTSAGVTEMIDVFCFAAPLPVLGRVAEMLVLRRYMRALLRERNAVLKKVAHENCHTGR